MTKPTKSPKIKIITWDWKEQIDLIRLNSAISTVYDGRNAPRIYEVETNEDCYAVIVAASEMTQDQVQAAWEAAQ